MQKEDQIYSQLYSSSCLNELLLPKHCFGLELVRLILSSMPCLQHTAVSVNLNCSLTQS